MSDMFNKNTEFYSSLSVGSNVMYQNEICRVDKVFNGFVALYKDDTYIGLIAFNLINPI